MKGGYKCNQIDNVRRHNGFDSYQRKTAAAAMNLQVLQPPEKRRRLLLHLSRNPLLATNPSLAMIQLLVQNVTNIDRGSKVWPYVKQNT